MKKLMKVLFVIGIGIGLLIAFTYKSPLEKLSEQIQVDLTQGKIIEISEEGFVDREVYVKIDFSSAEINKTKDGTWMSYPIEVSLNDKLSQLVDKEKIDITSIKEGCYKIIENDAYDISILIYDSAEEIMYYYSIK